MDGLMARNPYRKRTAQGAAQGAMSGAMAGYQMTGTPFGAIAGGLGGGIAGGLMARPGEDEKMLRARMRRLERGVLGDEEAAIMGRFVDPVAAAANEQMVRSRAVAPATAATGAQAREAIAGQRAARRDIGEAAQEGALAVMDLGEQRRMQAQRIREGLQAQDVQRDEAFRKALFEGGLDIAGQIGQDRALKQILAEEEKRRLAQEARQGRARANQADISAISDEELDAFQLGGGLAPTFTDEDVAALELGGGLVPRTREEIEARSPLIRERLAELSQRTGLPLGTEALQAPGSREALGTGLEPRGVIPQAEAELLGEPVRPSVEEPFSQRDQRDVKRIEQMFNAAGDDSLYSLLEQDGTLPDVLDMPDEQFDEYMFDLMPLGGGLVNRLGD